MITKALFTSGSIIPSGADVLVNCILNEGGRFIAGVPGEQILGILNSLYDFKGRIDFILMKDERNAVFFADAYYRLTGEPGICLSTLGPGATNLLTGLANAYLDRSALVAFTGQIATRDMVKEYHQRLSVSKFIEPVTKWSFTIQKAEIIPESVRKAFKTAKTEKPGPVHLELPSDVIAQKTDAKPLPLLLYEPRYPPGGNLDVIEKAFNYIVQAEFPVALIGNGVIRADAGENLGRFVEKLSLPVVSTYMGKGAIPEDSPLHLGVLGAFADDIPRKIIQRADVVVAFGYDFAELPADYWNGDQKRLVVHIDSLAAEIDRFYPVRYEIVGNINRTLLFMLEHDLAKYESKAERRKKDIEESKRQYVEQLFPVEEPKTLQPSAVVRVLNDTLGEDTIVTVDVGDHKLWMSRCLIRRKPRKFLVSNGLATMGFSLPAAIAAKTAFRDTPVVCATGDGGFMMSFGELETVMRLDLAFPILVFDNDSLGQIYTKQKIAYGERTIGVSLKNPDFIEIAKAFGLEGARIETEDDLKSNLQDALEDQKAMILDMKVDPEQTLRVVRKLGSTRPIY